ncbi:hypothetical protein HXY33_05485 [Candidatus Bathyarchaeota archaeon]|nr:hypothetical protein [Candidatus Bathyarchaeota archaeon]
MVRTRFNLDDDPNKEKPHQPIKYCRNCGKVFNPAKSVHYFCCDKCRRAFYRRRWRNKA